CALARPMPPCRPGPGDRWPSLSGTLRPVDTQGHRVKRGRAGDIHPVATRAAETQIRDDHGHLDLADQLTPQIKAAHPIPGRGPDPPVVVHSEPLGATVVDMGKGIAPAQLFAIDSEGADM